MKNIYLLSSFLIFLSCSQKKTGKISIKNKDSISLEQQIETFKSKLASNKVKPTFSTSPDSLSYFDKNLKIKTQQNENKFQIFINGNKIETWKLQTLNDVWNGKDSVTYVNELTRINYYKNLNLLLLQLDFNPCNGIGCSVNYQLIYDFKFKKVYPFGRFRTGFDMDLYKLENKNYYLSKTFHGRNAQLKDTIYYELYEIGNNIKKTGKPLVKFTFEKEDYDNETSFTEMAR